MSELILGIIILALIAFIAWREQHFSLERKDLIAGVLSKDIHEFRIATTPIDKKKEEPKTPSDLVEEQSLSDEEFFEAIKKSNE